MSYDRFVATEIDREFVLLFIQNRKLPFTITLTDGARRTTEQNKLQRKWMMEIAEQLGDMTPEEVRAYCKLTIGVPILRAQNEAFREKYDHVVRPLSYVQKLAIMSEPLDMPITRIMTTKQKTEYLDAIFRHFSEQGVVLTIPPDKYHPGATASVQAAPPPLPSTAPAGSRTPAGALSQEKA